MTTRTIDHSVLNHTGAHADHIAAGAGHYKRFAIMVGLSFVAMYVLMYAMVDAFSSVYMNINQFYMAGLMAAPMAIIEILLMRSMYPSKTLNNIILVASVAALILFWVGIRSQVAVGDQQFLRSMIPHHSGAILMCEKANLSDPALQNLCKEIIESQKSEIDQMQGMLKQRL